MQGHIVITGASSGIGAALAARLARRDGIRLSLGARRADRLQGIADGAFTHPLDVTDEASVEAFLAAATETHGPIDALVNNAGLARGTETVADADGIAWREMVETNIMGLLHVTRRVVPAMIARRAGHIVMIGSIAGREAYAGGSVYCGTKRAVQSIARSLRLETAAHGLRVTNVEPGLVETEFSLVRFRGDAEKARTPYVGMTPLSADDVADCVEWALTRPAHVCIDDILVKPTAQAAATVVHRDG